MAKSTGNESIVTPRRSPRLASKCSAAPSFLNFTFIKTFHKQFSLVFSPYTSGKRHYSFPFPTQQSYRASHVSEILFFVASFSEAFPPMPLIKRVGGCGSFKYSISASERSQIEKSINAWAIHTPSLLRFFFFIMDS